MVWSQQMAQQSLGKMPGDGKQRGDCGRLWQVELQWGDPSLANSRPFLEQSSGQ